MKKVVFFFFVFFFFQVAAQSVPNRFSELSYPIKKWVLLHAFKARKSLELSKESYHIADSIKKTNLLDGDAAGGEVDAFRHAYWMARLRQVIGEQAARSLGRAHERENYKIYKKRKLEDGVVPDKISSEMDLYNNEQGLQLISENSKTPKNGLIFRVVNAIKAGKMKILKKDTKGNFLTCEGVILLSEELKGKWENKKCLVSTNQTIE
jgi:hypothetical protein